MMENNNINDPKISTKEKIKSAARKVFHKKGFSATRTRDIAEEAGINLALLNYYFRSKQKLFAIIMLETVQDFRALIAPALNDPNTTLEEKLEVFVVNCIDFMKKEPEVPLFMVNEIKNNYKMLEKNLKTKEYLFNSEFIKQYEQAVLEGSLPNLNFSHFLLNVLALTIFPFLDKPLLTLVADMPEKEFNQLMDERKKLIPLWIKTMLKA